MTPNHYHPIRRCKTPEPPFEGSYERPRVARVSFLQTFYDHSMWYACRIWFADFVADRPVVLADSVDLHAGI